MKKLVAVVCAIVVSISALFCIIHLGGMGQNGENNPMSQEETGCNPENFSPVGGISGNYMTIKAGETKETSYIFYAGKGEGNVELSIKRVAGVFKTDELPMPEDVNVTVAPSDFYLGSNGKHTSKITVNVGSDFGSKLWRDYTGGSVKIENFVFLVRAKFEDKIIDDWLRVDVYPPSEDKAVYQPGRSLMGMAHPHTEHDESITLESGKKVEKTFVFYTGEAGLGKVNITVYRVSDVYKTERISSKGIDIALEPSCYMAKPHAYYNSTIMIDTSSGLSPGKYVFLIHTDLEDGVTGDSWLTVNVI